MSSGQLAAVCIQPGPSAGGILFHYGQTDLNMFTGQYF